MEVHLGSVNTSVSTQTEWSLKQLKEETAVCAYKLQKPWKGSDLRPAWPWQTSWKIILYCKAKQQITVLEKATDPTHLTVSKAIKDVA